jgi:acetyltransferase-like isoleucine patch superfamily enzyme
VIDRVMNSLRGWRHLRALAQLKEHRQYDGLPSLTLRIAVQRSRDTRIGNRCRFLGRVGSLNPTLIEIGSFCVPGIESILWAHGPGFDGSSLTVLGGYPNIGYRATVLPGFSIGSGRIIGAGSIVTPDIPTGKVALGNPAWVLGNVSPQEAWNIQYLMENNMFFGRTGTVP